MSAPSFQWYPNDWLGSQRVQMLSLEEEGAYIRLLGFCWKHGDIPADPDQLARLIGKGASTTLARVVATMFTVDDHNPGRLIHDRLEEERRKQEEWRAKCAKGGKNSAKARQNGKGSSTTVGRVVQQQHEESSNKTPTLQSSSSTTSSKEEVGVGKKQKTEPRAKSAEEAEEYALSIGCMPGQGDAFFWKMEGCGWMNGGKPVKNWKATVMAWERQGYMPVPVNYKPATAKAEEQKADEWDPEAYRRRDRSGEPMYATIMALMNKQPLPGAGEEYEYFEQERD